MSRLEIRARLLERLPDRMDGSDSKDLSILKKAIMGAGSKNDDSTALLQNA